MDLVLVFGPPAVGKMTVGRELCARTGFRLFHNHAVMEPLLEVFEHGTPPFNRLLPEFRRRVVEEAVGSGTAGLVCTLVWAVELDDDTASVADLVGPALRGGGRLRFVELVAPLAVRQERNNTPARLDAKPSKRDRAFNDANLLQLEGYVMNTGGPLCAGARALLDAHPHLRLDNSDLAPAEVARQVADWLDSR